MSEGKSPTTVFCFDLMHRSERCGSSWARVAPVAGGGFLVECRLQIFEAVEIGLLESRRQSEYGFDQDGALISAKLWDQNGNHVASEFMRHRMQVGGRSLELERPITCVLEQNMVALSAILLERAVGDGEASFAALVPEAGTVLPYEITAHDGIWRSNLGETFKLDATGHIQEVRPPASDFHFVRNRRGFPKWSLHGTKTGRDYSPPSHIRSSNVKVSVSPDAGRVRDGTIVRPKTDLAEQAVAVFIGGTGVYDRHGRTAAFDIGYHQLLDDLAAEGMASLRYERFDPDAANLEEAEGKLGFADMRGEADCALNWLAEQPWASNLPKVVIGHSLGGLVALELSVRRNDLDAIVLLASPGRTFREIVQDQQGWLQQELKTGRKTGKDIQDLNRAFIQALESDVAWTTETVGPRILAFARKRKLYGEILDIDPALLMSKGSCPVIIVQGTADVQVGVNDAARLADACKKSGRPYQLMMEDGLDHLLKRNRETGLKVLKAYRDRRRRIPIQFIRKLAQAVTGFGAGAS